MLASIHNLHYYLNLMREVREALDAGRVRRVRWRAFAPTRSSRLLALSLPELPLAA